MGSIFSIPKAPDTSAQQAQLAKQQSEADAQKLALQTEESKKKKALLARTGSSRSLLGGSMTGEDLNSTLG